MFLTVWKSTKDQIKNQIWYSNSIFDYSSDFFSAPTILDVFTSDTDKNLLLPHIQQYLANGTFDFMLSLDFFSQESYTKSFFNVDLFSSFTSNISTELFNSSLGQNYASIAGDIVNITKAKTNVFDLRAVFMEFNEEIGMFDIVLNENDIDLHQTLSTPDVKLYYPEPFIASPSFVHEDLWYIHILHYQHWLWFMFITLIMFYFITFINVVRWCNMRTRPRRETRGVSRSKCADLITATVPVSWAASIIITESVDAADYYDGFGTGEMIVGIRAYQWGWEYFYPKGIDLNYNVTPSYSAVVGNSLKYTTTEGVNLKANTLWKHYKLKKASQITSTPAHLVLGFNDNSKVLNFINLAQVGLNTSKDASSFKKIQYFSKTNPQGLFNNTSDFQSRYNKLSDLYLNTTGFNNASNYGTLRQHNLVSVATTTNGCSTFLDKKGLDKVLSYNLKNHKTTHTLPTSDTLKPALFNLLDSYGKSTSMLFFTNTVLPNIGKLLDSSTDHKHPNNTLKFLLTNKTFSGEVVDGTHLKDFINKGGLTLNYPTSNYVNATSVVSKNYLFKDNKSANMQFLTSEKNIRPLNSLAVGKTTHNLTSNTNNFSSVFDTLKLDNVTTNQFDMFNSSKLNWSSSESLSRLVASNTVLDPAHPPVRSNNPNLNPTSFDRVSGGTPTMLKSKEEVSPTYLFNAYWLSRWGHTNPQHRYTNWLDRTQSIQKGYFPRIVDYAEYDFRNWLALELLEDAYWESSVSAYAQDDYLNALDVSVSETYFPKQDVIFNTLNRTKEFKDGISVNKTDTDIEFNDTVSNLPIFSEDGLLDINLLSLKNFEPFNNETNLDLTEDSYENLKYLTYIYSNNYKNILLTTANNTLPTAYTQVLDAFRPDFEEKTTHSDGIVSNSEDVTTGTGDTISDRLSNPFKLRASSKNAIVTYNALQKVYRARFDEGRSNARLQDFSNSAVSHPFLTAPKTPYERLLGKNKESFFELTRYNHTLTDDFSTMYKVWSSMNVYLADLPFLLSMKSDPTRYLWFDWQSRWSSIEHQPSSTARYSLLGVPYSTKNYEYETSDGDTINDSETYLIKLAHARKNYMSNWAYTPYFYAKTSNWYKLNVTASFLFKQVEDFKDFKFILKFTDRSWDEHIMLNSLSKTSTPSYSGVNVFNKSSWRPQAGVQSYYYNTSILVDILSKREFLYRQYLLKQNISVNLPKYLTASPNNPLLLEVKNAYPLINPSSFVSEVSRECFYQNSSYLKFFILKDFIELLNSKLPNSTINLTGLTDYLFFYLFNTSSTSLGRNVDLYKNQFRPMRKGVMNMIRLHATGAIAMPTEIRMHILASSRDVIHSWAIPSAGIKIDCVPGYSSHRVTIFLVSGIFWGQCMEICGRFHHWMPIIVYFMKRDLFFLWCTHFMHYSHPDKVFNMCDRQLMDHVRLVSFDKTSWVHELNSII